MSKENLLDSWKTKKFRTSVVDKIDEALKDYRLKKQNPGVDIENAIYEQSKTKCQYLGYVGKIILNIRRMVRIQDEWLQNYVKEVLGKPSPRVRKVLRPDELAKYNLDLMKLRQKIRNESESSNNE